MDFRSELNERLSYTACLLLKSKKPDSDWTCLVPAARIQDDEVKKLTEGCSLASYLFPSLRVFGGTAMIVQYEEIDLRPGLLLRIGIWYGA